jgi:phosphatidylglycerol:prolipoprotein diacylglycerol transferase
MKPFLFHIGPIGVPAFFFMIMIAALSSTFYMYHLMKKEKGLDPVVALDFGIIGIIASVVGSRALHILVENPAYYWEKPIRVFYFWQGGFVSLGAYLFTFISLLVYLRVRKLNPWPYIDQLARVTPIIIFFVRMGCLCAGCCYGKPTDFFLHLTFSHPESAAGSLYSGVPLHATQIYNMFNAVVMFTVLWFVFKHRRYYGQVLVGFFLYYGVSRFIIEFLRGDVDRGLWFNDTLSSGQVAMIGSVLVGIVLHFFLHRKESIAKK